MAGPYRLDLRSVRGARRRPAGAPGTRHTAVRNHLACHDVGWSRRSARQPDAQPSRGAVRCRELGDPRSSATVPPAGTTRTHCAGQRQRVAITSSQSPARLGATGDPAKRRAEGHAATPADQAFASVQGKTGRKQTTPIRDEASTPGPVYRRLTAQPRTTRPGFSQENRTDPGRERGPGRAGQSARGLHLPAVRATRSAPHTPARPAPRPRCGRPSPRHRTEGTGSPP
jgi:hypothetical protein